MSGESSQGGAGSKRGLEAHDADPGSKRVTQENPFPGPRYPSLKVQLLLHQEEGLDFLRNREHGILPSGSTLSPHFFPNGGILADEMGLGKTVEMLALVTELGGTTLIVVPKNISTQWVKEIGEKTSGSKVFAYTEQMDLTTIDLSDYNIVITTYSRLLWDYKSMEEAKNRGQTKPMPLETFVFNRIVCDEAHTITNPGTTTSKACTHIRNTVGALHVWMLTGTPIVNKVGDLRALLTIVAGKGDQYNWLTSPPNNTRTFTLPNNTTLRLVKLTELMVLRRTKEILDLPELIEIVGEMPTFNEFEGQCYKKLLGAVQSLVQDMEEEAQEEGENTFFRILELLLYLRQACNSLATLNPKILLSLAPCKETGENERRLADAMKELLGSDLRRGDGDGEEVMVDGAGSNDSLPEEVKNFLDKVMRRSTKTDLVLQYLKNMEGKVLIFSHSVRYLNILRQELLREEYTCLQIDGSVAPDERDNLLEKFKTDDAIPVLLMTYKVGGTGLNITAACNVILVDMWWHKVFEDQAIARAHRIGQTRPVKYVRLFIDKSVEVEMMNLQHHKHGISEFVFNKKAEHEIPLRTKINVGTLIALLSNLQADV